jgi:hypothetical protein
MEDVSMIRLVLAGLVLALLPALPVTAQTSSLQCIVSDAQGAVVPEAVITATNQATALVRGGISDSKGEYTFAQMPPGTYKLEAKKPGFREYATTITLQTDTPLTLDIKMEIGQIIEVVNVEGQAAVVNTENATVGNPFNETQVRQIPMQVRNVVALLGVQAGVAPNGQVSATGTARRSAGPSGKTSSSSFSITRAEPTAARFPCCRPYRLTHSSKASSWSN